MSRSGATISAGLLRDLDRVTATRLSFFLGIPALTAAGMLEAVDAPGRDQRHASAGARPSVGIVVSFVVAYASIAWLLRFVVAQLDHPVRLVPGRRSAACSSPASATGVLTAT